MKGLHIFVGVICTIMLITAYVAYRSYEPPSKIDRGVYISFLDVGQADATLITFQDGSQLLLDCGRDARVLESLGRHMTLFDRTIEYLVLTHPDADHYGGCVDVLDRFSIHTIIHTTASKSHDGYQAFLRHAESEGAQIVLMEQPLELQIVSSTVSFLFPHAPLETFHQLEGANNQSIVTRLSFEDQQILFPGDAEAELEQALVDWHTTSSLKSTILKASHHGSGGSSIQAFLEKVNPDHVIFSAGDQNAYGHPSGRVLRRVERIGATPWRTDTQGDILIHIQGGVSIEAQHGNSEE